MRTVRHAGAAVAALALAVSAEAAQAQASRLGPGGQPSVEIARSGAARVLQSEGPSLPGRREFYRPVPPLALRHRWILVQDSTFGVVFTDASGIRTDLSDYVGDIYLRSLEGVRAVEVRALVFDIWGDDMGYLSTTLLAEHRSGDTWDLHPRWSGEGASTAEHRTSIVWIHRVMFDDESILESDTAPVAAAWAHVTGSTLERLPDESLRRAVGP
jgi:hypothetical protein